MRIDPGVQRTKFAREVQTLRDHAATLREWGIWCVGDENPTVDLVVLPRNPLRLTLPVQATPGGLVLPGPQHVRADLPTLAARAIGVRISLDDFDQRPPSVSFRDPWTWEVPGYEALPRASVVGPGGGLMSVILQGLPPTGLPFLCIRGVREYHEHPQHSGDDWALYRGSWGLFALIQRIWQICVNDVRPNIILTGVPGQPPLQVRWETEQRPR